MQTSDVNQAHFWEAIYQSESPGWDLGEPAPPFVSLLAGPSPPPPGRIAILGCGTGNDVSLFAAHGFEAVGVDFAPSAIGSAENRLRSANLKAKLIQEDIFNLPSVYHGHFDYVLEHTCFCAIDPSRRQEYVRMVEAILRPTGKFIALFYLIPPGVGPPFGTTEKEIRSLFENAFEVLELRVPTDSVERRRGKEMFAVMAPRPKPIF
jgi:SAM-dependent methyltransferase